jgi:hypothetical protein
VNEEFLLRFATSGIAGKALSGRKMKRFTTIVVIGQHDGWQRRCSLNASSAKTQRPGTPRHTCEPQRNRWPVKKVYSRA